MKYGLGWRPPPVDRSSTRCRSAKPSLVHHFGAKHEIFRTLLVDPEFLAEIRRVTQSRLGEMEFAALR